MRAEETTVVFRVWKKPNHGVLALFPHEDYDRLGHLCMSYEHVGQHGGADYSGCVAMTRPATTAEYQPLKRELEGFGYNLIVKRRRHGR
jgi:hypothetical protein